MDPIWYTIRIVATLVMTGIGGLLLWAAYLISGNVGGAAIAWMVLLGLAIPIGFFALFTLVASGMLHPQKYNKVKLEPYECGIEPITGARDRYSIRYYLVAMLFVIFDVETVFMFPWAVIFNKLLLFGLIEMLVFIFILVVGYYYAWQKGALEWA